MNAHSPTQLHALFQDAFNRADVEALVGSYEPDAILIVGGQQIKGRENIRAAFGSMVSAGAQMRLATQSCIESSDSLALLHGEWIVERTAATVRDRTTQELVREQPDGTWRFIIDNPYTLTMKIAQLRFDRASLLLTEHVQKGT